MSEDKTMSPLVRDWLKAASVLGLKVEAPCMVALPSGATVVADVLVHQFGASKGTLILRRYDDIRQQISELQAVGFGFSVMSDPRQNEAFEVQQYVDVLRDWGWSGAPDEEPLWMSPK